MSKYYFGISKAAFLVYDNAKIFLKIVVGDNQKPITST